MRRRRSGRRVGGRWRTVSRREGGVAVRVENFRVKFTDRPRIDRLTRAPNEGCSPPMRPRSGGSVVVNLKINVSVPPC